MASVEQPLDAVLNGIGQAVLIFDGDGQLRWHNTAASAMLGKDLRLLQAGGWRAAVPLFSTRDSNPDLALPAIRERAARENQPVRFSAFRGGVHVPAWAAVITMNGQPSTVLTFEQPDWSALTELFDHYLQEVRESAESTGGHADLIQHALRKPKPNESVEALGRRISGFATLIQTHMHRLSRLTLLMARLERLRTGQLKLQMQAALRPVAMEEFVEDLIEALAESPLLDPETEQQDVRRRLKVEITGEPSAIAAPDVLAVVLRDMLRNAIMYSLKGTPVTLSVRQSEAGVQIDVADEGYGIRASEVERVFVPHQRGRQPQVIGEFGYGLSLYLCKHEVEAMGGWMWFESEEGAGTTFSIKLPSRLSTVQSRSGKKPA